MEYREWSNFLIPYSQAVQELIVKFENIISEYRSLDRYSPVEQVSGRVKSVESILDKMRRQDISMEDLEDRMTDIAGIRIICRFVEDIDTLSETIEHYDELSKKLDPSACHSNNDEFCAHLNKIVDQMLK